MIKFKNLLNLTLGSVLIIPNAIITSSILNSAIVDVYANFQDSSHGVSSADTGSGSDMFASEGYRMSGTSINPNQMISVCDDFCNTQSTMTIDQMLTNALDNAYSPSEIAEIKADIYSSDDVWFSINADKTRELGYPVFYYLDGTPKDFSEGDGWLAVPGDKEGNKLLAEYREMLDAAMNGDVKSGRFTTSMLWSKMKGVKGRNGGGKRKPTPPNRGKQRRTIIQGCTPQTTPPTYRYTHTADRGNPKITGDYSVLVKVEPVKPAGFEKLTAQQQADWEATHKTQIEGPVLTPFGEYLDKNRDTIRKLKEYGKSGGVGVHSSYRRLWEKFARGAQEAAAKPLPKLDIQMSDENKEGFGRGGTFTFSEQVKKATVSTNHAQDLYDKYECVQTSQDRDLYIPVPKGQHDTTRPDGNGGTIYLRHDPVTIITGRVQKTRSNVERDGNFTKNGVFNVIGTDYNPTVSYQMLNVRCNIDDFRSLAARTNSEILTFGSGNGSATAKSPIVKNSLSTAYNDVDVDFYYSGKSCNQIWGCSTSPNAGGVGDASYNKQDKGDIDGVSFGAQSKEKISSNFEFFRDNVPNLIRNDVSVPADRNVGEEIGEWQKAATATFITLDPTGTPAADMFTLQDEDEKTLITGKELPSKNYLLFDKEVNKFNWKASWASEKDRPHGMNIRYAYKPIIKNTSVEAWNRENASTGITQYNLDIFCDVEFDTLEVKDPIIKNTPKSEPYQPITKFNNDKSKTLKVSFVKSSVE